MIGAYLDTARPKQWTKNLFVFAALLFSHRFFEPHYFIKVSEAFILFCLASSGIYYFNDLVDLELDRAHPIKKNRPLASGRLTIKSAKITCGTLLVVSLTLSYLVSASLFWVLLLYIITHIAYSVYLKRVVIIDLLIVAFGFVLRVVAGSVVIGVQISSWLFICTALLSLFLILAKRRQEIKSTGDNSTRPVLQEYSLEFVDQMITATAASTITAYLLYAFSPETALKFGGQKIAYSVPFVLYGILRYLYLIYKRSLGEEPEKILLTDPPFMINLLAWICSIFIAIYF